MRLKASLVILALLTSFAFVSAYGQPSVPLWKTLPKFAPLPTPDQRGLLPLNGASIYFAIFNRAGGHPVFLLHGGLGSSDAWGDEVRLLAKNRSVIVVDSRGHGRSTLGGQPLGYGLMATDILGVMDALKIKKASIVGWSDGGIIGLMLASHHPDRVDKLFVFGASFNSSETPPESPDPAMSAEFRARAEAAYRATSPTPDGFPKLIGALRAMYQHEPYITPAELGAITARTVVADGQYEQFISRRHTRTLAGLIPNARLVIMPNVSHGGPAQDPLGFYREVVKLLDGR